MEKIAIIGAGGWGTALSIIFSKKFEIILWEKFPEYADILINTRKNPEFLPGFTIPSDVVITSNLHDACVQASILIIVVPSRYFRNVITQVKIFYKNQDVIIATKGLEPDTGLRMSEILCCEIGNKNVAIFAGPTIASEVAAGKPAAAVIAATDIDIARKFQKKFSSTNLRLYTSTDICGLEIAGGYKNVLAIGSGIIDEICLGDNAKAAYLTRGVHEMKNFGMQFGAKEKTFWGLAGIGDLITTSNSPNSRNHRFGMAVAAGKGKEFLSGTKMMVEGISAVQAIVKMSEKYNVEIPIASAIYRIVYRDSSPEEEVVKLMTRRLKDE